MPRKKKKERTLDKFSLAKQLESLEATLDAEAVLKWPYVGLGAANFPLLSERIDGLRNNLYVLAGASRMGKTSFALQYLVSCLLDEPEARGIFVSLEQPARELNIRLVAQLGGVNMEYLLNPTREGAHKYEDNKRKGLEAAFELKERLTIIDESLGAIRLDDLQKIVAEYREDFEGPLVVVVDPLFKLRVGASEVVPREDLIAHVARELKTLSTLHEVAILATTGVSGAAGKRRPELSDLEEQAALLYDAHVIALLYCDFFNNAETPFLEWAWGSDDLMVPIFELNVAKNKMGAFSGRLYYRFFNSQSAFRECASLEIDNYNRMLYNLRVHSEADPLVDDQLIGRFEDLDSQK
jgi:replicative DNA helicase